LGCAFSFRLRRGCLGRSLGISDLISRTSQKLAYVYFGDETAKIAVLPVAQTPLMMAQQILMF
jgi:hypothetical protein